MENGDQARAANFDCGVPVLNDWIQKRAWSSHQGGGARVYVSVDNPQDLIASYICLSAAQADHAVVPPRVAKGMAQSPIPVVLIGRFAVDSRYMGSGLGAFMIRHAFVEVLKVADRIGVRAIMVDAKDATSASFYTHLGFSASIGNALRLFIMIKDVKISLVAAGVNP